MNDPKDYGNPAYAKPAFIQLCSIVATASAFDGENYFPVTIDYEINHDTAEITILRHNAYPTQYDDLLWDIYDAVKTDSQLYGAKNYYTINRYKL